MSSNLELITTLPFSVNNREVVVYRIAGDSELPMLFVVKDARTGKAFVDRHGDPVYLDHRCTVQRYEERMADFLHPTYGFRNVLAFLGERVAAI